MKCFSVIHDIDDTHSIIDYCPLSINYDLYSFVRLGSHIRGGYATKIVISDGAEWYVYLLYAFKPQLWGEHPPPLQL